MEKQIKRKVELFILYLKQKKDFIDEVYESLIEDLEEILE